MISNKLGQIWTLRTDSLETRMELRRLKQKNNYKYEIVTGDHKKCSSRRSRRGHRVTSDYLGQNPQHGPTATGQ